MVKRSVEKLKASFLQLIIEEDDEAPAIKNPPTTDGGEA